MICTNPDCLGHYDFDNIVHYAKKRFVEGCTTVALMEQAGSEREKEEIALVSLLDVEDDQIRDLELTCRYDKQCKVLDCRDRLRKLIQDELTVSPPSAPHSEYCGSEQE
jgi:hypothetical protein